MRSLKAYKIISKAILLFGAVLILGLSGCRTQRSATLRQESAASGRVDFEEESRELMRAASQGWMQAWGDSLRVVFTADSIVTADGTAVYAPRLEVEVVAPQVEASVASAEDTEATTHTELSTQGEARQVSEGEESGETTAVAEPAGRWLIGVAAVLLLTLGLIILLIIYLRHRTKAI